MPLLPRSRDTNIAQFGRGGDVKVEVRPTGGALSPGIRAVDLCAPTDYEVEGICEALLDHEAVSLIEIQLYACCLADHYPREREVRRCVIDGDRPV